MNIDSGCFFPSPLPPPPPFLFLFNIFFTSPLPPSFFLFLFKYIFKMILWLTGWKNKLIWAGTKTACWRWKFMIQSHFKVFSQYMNAECRAKWKLFVTLVWEPGCRKITLLSRSMGFHYLQGNASSIAFHANARTLQTTCIMQPSHGLFMERTQVDNPQGPVSFRIKFAKQNNDNKRNSIPFRVNPLYTIGIMFTTRAVSPTGEHYQKQPLLITTT